jgi:hypothetical protein
MDAIKDIMSKTLDEFQSLPENIGQGKKLSLPGFELRTVLSAVCRYIYCADLASAVYSRCYYSWEYS